MKKLIVAAVAVAFAAVSQAASVAWGGAISLPDGETELEGDTMAYLVWSTSAFSGTGAEFDGTDLTIGGAAVATMVHSYQISADDAAAWSFMATYDNPGNDVNGYYAILVGDKAGEADNYSFYGFEVAGTNPQTAGYDAVAGHNWDPDFLTQDGFTVAAAGGGGDTPEPTSAMLILLGMAGLALKRKQA